MPVGKVSKLIFSNLFKPLSHCCEKASTNHPAIAWLQHFSSIPNGPMRGEESNDDPDPILRALMACFDEDGTRNQNPPRPIPDKPLREEKPPNPSENLFLRNSKTGFDVDDDDGGGGGGQGMKRSHHIPPTQLQNRPMGGGQRDERSYTVPFNRKLDFGSNLDNAEKMNQSNENYPFQFAERFMGGEKRDNQLEDSSFLEKFKIGEEKMEKSRQSAPSVTSDMTEDKAESDTPVDAEEYFKKMKETGLMPNAVAMLEYFCKDGLAEEAKKLVALMREKGTIPQVVTYTAVVEGFCKAHKFDDAKRIFRKMQNNSISPNAFSYGVMVQGLCKGRKLEDAVEFCVEMLEAGHLPNVTTFVGLVNLICKEKGLEEAKNVIGRLREKGFFVDENAVREHLEKKGPFLPIVWEATFGKKSSERPF